MTYLRFSTLSWATRGINQIDENLRTAIAEANPDALDEQGNLIGRNAKTGQLDPNAGKTTTWAEPQQQADGSWVIPKPDLSHPVFAGVNLLDGVGGYTEIETPVFPDGDVP